MPRDRKEYLPLMNMKDKTLYTRAASVITDPQASILEAVKERNHELLTAILNDETILNEINLDHVYDDGAMSTLLHSAIDVENEEAVRLLVKEGIDCNKFNKAKAAPLHQAAKKGLIGVLQILLRSGKCDVNATMPNNGETILHILARRCGKSTTGSYYDIYVECLKWALRFPEIKVDVKENTASMTPLFIASEESHSKDAAIALIKANADINLTIDGINIRESLIKNFGEDILMHQSSDISEALSGIEIGNRSKLLSLLNESVVKDTLEEFKKELESLQYADDLNKSAPGAHNLIQVACEQGLAKHLGAMLKIQGVDVNQCSQGTEPGILLAAKFAHGSVLNVLFNHHDTKITICADLGTVLHTILRKPLPYKNYEDALNLLLESTDAKNKLKEIINLKDSLGNTALHYATQFWPQTVVRELLELGANIGLKNIYGEVPINRILPETMEEFLNDFCLTSKGSVTNSDFKITASFDFLVPFGTNLTTTNKINNKITDEIAGGVEDDEEIPLPETEGLWYMSQSKKHKYLLKHPVIATFLWMKWKKAGSKYNKNILMFLAFVAFITCYIFVLYSGQSVRSDSITVQFGNHTKDECKIDAIVKSDVTFLKFGSIVFLILLMLRELFQFGIAPRRYIFTLENWLDIALIVLTSILLFDGDYGCHIRTKRHLAAFIIVLSWCELITMVGRHPKLTQINIYVTMLYKVLYTFILFLTWYSLFIFAFGLGFYILLHKDHDVNPEEDYLFFNTLGYSIVKTFTMFVGELEFGDLPIDTGFGYVYLLCFVFLIVVVLMNLLNGLAVSDTGVIRAEAEEHAYKTQVDLISYIESTILGDPFNFLSNWPTYVWLNLIPTCSLVGSGRLYRVPRLRTLYHKITRAKGIMLFQGTNQNHPNGYRISFMPNQENMNINFLCGCCSAKAEDGLIEDLPTIVAESAKDVVLESIRRQAEESSKDQLEKRLAKMESILYKLLEISNK